MTTVTVQNTPADTTPCININATLSGTAKLPTDSTDLDSISANPLGSRTLTIERRPGGGSWSDWSSVTVGSSGTWSKTFTSATTGIWDYRASFDGEVSTVPPTGPSLHASTSGIKTLTWISSPCPL